MKWGESRGLSGGGEASSRKTDAGGGAAGAGMAGRQGAWAGVSRGLPRGSGWERARERGVGTSTHMSPKSGDDIPEIGPTCPAFRRGCSSFFAAGIASPGSDHMWASLCGLLGTGSVYRPGDSDLDKTRVYVNCVGGISTWHAVWQVERWRPQPWHPQQEFPHLSPR